MSITVPTAYVAVPAQALVGVQRGDNEPLAQIGLNTNYLYAHHRPPLLNVCPCHEDEDATQNYVFELEASADGLDYEIYIAISTSTGGDFSFKVDKELLANPQPSTGADWTNLLTASPTNWTSLGTDTRAWSEAKDFTADTSKTRYRVSVYKDSGANAMRVESILILPKALTSIASGVKSSGFLPYDDALLTQDDEAVHGEWINRFAKNAQVVMADRQQCVGAWCVHDNVRNRSWSPGASPYGATYDRTYLGAYMHGQLHGQAGAQIEIRIGAYDSSDGGLIVVGEVGGDTIEFTVDNNGGEYRYQRATITLRSDSPMLYALFTPATRLYLTHITAHWTPGD